MGTPQIRALEQGDERGGAPGVLEEMHVGQGLKVGRAVVSPRSWVRLASSTAVLCAGPQDARRCQYDPLCAHPDEILRTVANRMAAAGSDRMPVLHRDDASRLVGIVSITMLLAARQRDVQEAADAERVLTMRPRWLSSR